MTNKPAYTVVDPNPGFGKTVTNFYFSDYLAIGGFTYAGYLVGWFGGKLYFKYSSLVLISFLT